MNKKTEKIEIRIDSNTKALFIQYAKSLNKSVSDLLREYIKGCVNNESIN